MALNARQQLVYVHLCHLYKPNDVTLDANGKVIPADSYTLAYSSVKCRYRFTPNVSDPIPGAGRGKRMTFFTTDHCRMDVAQEIGEGWILKNVTSGQNSGAYHMVEGAPRYVPSSAARDTNFLQVELMTVEKAPQGVS